MMKSNDNTNKYDGISDEELIDRYRNGESAIIDFLMIKYKNLVLGKTKSMYLLGGETEDLIQEGMIGLFQAVNNYDFGRDASFYTFADLCITRKIYNAIKASNDKKHSFLNNYTSLYASRENDENSNITTLVEQLPAFDDSNPEKLAITNELKEQLETAINVDLTEMEREVFSLYLTGIGGGEIARILGRSPKETDNAIQRAKLKLKKVVKKNN